MNGIEEMKWNYLSSCAGKSTRNLFLRIINKLTDYQFAKWFLKKEI